MDNFKKVELSQRLSQVSMKRVRYQAILFETLAAIEDQYYCIGAIKEADFDLP
jgi:hypothetical protein